MTTMPAPARQEPDSKSRLRLWLRILGLSRRVEADLRRKLRDEFATTLPRFDVMAALYQHLDGLKMSELSGVLKVSNGNVTGIVDRLVEDGLAERIAVKGDRRASLVRLTGRGTEQFEEQAAAHERWIDDVLGPLSAAKAEEISHLLAALGPQGTEKDRT